MKMCMKSQQRTETFKGTEVSRKSVASLAVQIAKTQNYTLKKILV